MVNPVQRKTFSGKDAAWLVFLAVLALLPLYPAWLTIPSACMCLILILLFASMAPGLEHHRRLLRPGVVRPLGVLRHRGLRRGNGRRDLWRGAVDGNTDRHGSGGRRRRGHQLPLLQALRPLFCHRHLRHRGDLQPRLSGLGLGRRRPGTGLPPGRGRPEESDVVQTPRQATTTAPWCSSC